MTGSTNRRGKKVELMKMLFAMLRIVSSIKDELDDF